MQTGTTLRNRYRILQKLGRGGFGDTYLAEDGDLPGKPRCVVKYLQAQNPEIIAKANDGIPEKFARFQQGGEFYLILEYIEDKKLTHSKQWGENANRRQLLRWLAFGSAGFAGAVFAKALDIAKPAQAASPSGATI